MIKKLFVLLTLGIVIVGCRALEIKQYSMFYNMILNKRMLLGIFLTFSNIGKGEVLSIVDSVAMRRGLINAIGVESSHGGGEHTEV